jgi:hypothetical protein
MTSVIILDLGSVPNGRARPRQRWRGLVVWLKRRREFSEARSYWFLAGIPLGTWHFGRRFMPFSFDPFDGLMRYLPHRFVLVVNEFR